MKRILIVDDEPNVRNSIRIALSKIGYEVETAYDGVNAFEKFKASHFDVVVTDIVMPKEDGMGLALKIKKHTNRVKLITMSGGGKYAHPELYVSMNKIFGIDYSFTKPIDCNLLVEAIEGRLKYVASPSDNKAIQFHI